MRWNGARENKCADRLREILIELAGQICPCDGFVSEHGFTDFTHGWLARAVYFLLND